MGDLRSCSPELNVDVTEEKPSSSSFRKSSLSSSNQSVIGDGYWERAEEATQGIIAQVKPTVVSEQRRKAVIDYVQRLIRNCLGCEVFPFGSVPLRTYLPDGDIDLTAFGAINLEEALASDVCSVLESEDQNRAAEFIVKDVQLIRAEVKLVKCLVQNIVVDISFNQLGGLCTLCFLEQIDRLIGKNHLFKRSIILIKAWCYYESRILGAHHGLISTYALETLVLYIFHIFHSSLNGPLEVLYKFLDYFSKFDWDNYCISLNGPVRISSLPELTAEVPENGGSNLLLSNDFLKSCMEQFSVPERGQETISRAFPPKHLNIVDPLKENNNLGRSVSKGNFYRIKSAFGYGARKLARIISHPEENIEGEIHKFFSNTLDRHGGGQRPDVQDPLPTSGHYGFSDASIFSGTESQENQRIYELGSLYSSKIMDQEGSSHVGISDVKLSARQASFDRTINDELVERSFQANPSTMSTGVEGLANGLAVSECRLCGDANGLATLSIDGLKITNDAPKCFISSVEESKSSPMGKAPHAPHLYFAISSMGNGETRNGEQDEKLSEISGCTDEKASLGHPQRDAEEAGLHDKKDENHLAANDDILVPLGSKQCPSHLSSIALSSEDGYQMSANSDVTPEGFTSLSDLSGDFDSHLKSLHYGRWCYDYALTAAFPPMSPPFHSHVQNKKPWDAIQPPVVEQNPFTHMNSNGLFSRPSLYPINPPILPSTRAFGLEEMPKPRGTGTYFPNMSHYRDRPFPSRGRTNHVPVRSPRNNGRASTFPESNFPERSNHDLPPAQNVYRGSGKFVYSGYSSNSPRRTVHHNANGSMHWPEKVVEFGSVGHLQMEPPIQEKDRQPDSLLAPFQNSSINVPTPEMQKPRPVTDTPQDRIDVKSYELKDEDDFPPLSM